MIRSKDKFAEMFKDLFHRVSFVNKNISFEEFLEKTKGLDTLICKPVYGTHGEGVEKIAIPDDMEGKKQVYDLLMSKKKSQIEEVIVQHHEISEFCSTSVNTVRLMTILDNGKVNYMYSVLRLGTGGLIDGAGGGGFFAPIDVESGIVCRDGMSLEGGEKFIVHPVSGKTVKGFQVPNWDKVLQLAETAAKRLEGAHMIGWDIAVTEEGASLIEGNSESNYYFAQLPYIEEGVGVRYKFEPFLK